MGRGKKKKKRTHKGCKVHYGPRGGAYVMKRKKKGGTRRQYINP